MRFNSFADIEISVWLRQGRATVLCRSFPREGYYSSYLDPVVIGKMIHWRVDEMMRDYPDFLAGWDSLWGAPFSDQLREFNPDVEAGTVGAKSSGNLLRTAAHVSVRSDGYEARFWGWSPYDYWSDIDGKIENSSILSSRPPLCPPGELSGGGDPLLIAPWWDPEMLGHGVLTMLRKSGPPLNKGMVSVFEAPVGKRRSALHRAALEGRVDALPVRKGGKRKLDPVDTLGVTPQMLAAGGGHAAFVARLLDLGSNPDLRDCEGRTALHYAAEQGHGLVMGRLIEAGAAVASVDGCGDTPLHLSSVGGHVEAARVLLAAGAPPDIGDMVYSSSPLHKAARGGYAALATLLGAAGADVNITNERGRTPLHVAAGYGHVEMVAALIENGADVNRRDHRGETSLHLPAFYQHLDCMTLLIQHGADVGAVDSSGNTPLHLAASMNRRSAARLLVESGSDVEAVNAEGMTPIDLAIVNVHKRWHPSLPSRFYIEYEPALPLDEHNSEVAEALLEAGAVIDPSRILVSDRHLMWPHLTPLEFLRPTGDLDNHKLPDVPEAMRAALPKYDEWEITHSLFSWSASKPSLLHDAVFKDMPVVVEALLKSGAAPMTAVRNVATPLHFAAVQGNLELASLLLDWGADNEMPRCNVTDGRYDRDPDGFTGRGPNSAMNTPLDDAIVMGQVEMARFLLTRGATPPGRTPSHRPVSECPEDKRDEMVSVLREFGAFL